MIFCISNFPVWKLVPIDLYNLCCHCQTSKISNSSQLLKSIVSLLVSQLKCFQLFCLFIYPWSTFVCAGWLSNCLINIPVPYKISASSQPTIYLPGIYKMLNNYLGATGHVKLLNNLFKVEMSNNQTDRDKY